MKRHSSIPLFFFTLLFLAACGSSDTTQPPQPTPVPMPSPIVQPPPVVPPTTPPVTPPTTPPTTPPPSGTTISGTVTAPAGGDVISTGVGACPIAADGSFNCGDAGAIIITITQSGPSAPYSLNVLAEQPYAVVAVKDTNSSGGIDDGDYRTYYPTFDSPSAVIAPASGIDLTMEIVGGDSATPPTTPPTTPPGGSGGSISGTVTAAAGSDVAATEVWACPVEADCASRVTTEIVQSGPSAVYSIDNLSTGQYVVIAVQDVNDDGTPEYIGGYPTADTLSDVQAPASGIDVQLVPFTPSSVNALGLDKLELNKSILNKVQGALQ